MPNGTRHTPWQGDKVRIAFYAKRRGREAEGEVIEILERANDTFVGTLEVAKSYAFLVTENRTLPMIHLYPQRETERWKDRRQGHRQSGGMA